jgi:DNA replication protein DnaC
VSDCPHDACDGSGFVIDEATNTARDCTCRPGRRSKLKARRLEARLPKRYRDVAFERSPVVDMPDSVVRQVRRFTREVDRNVGEGRGIWFVGQVGTGKTTLAMLVSKAALAAGRTCAIYSLPRLLNVLRDAIGNEQSTLELLDRLNSVDLLHLDDVGAENSSEWVLEQLYSIINTRYEDERSLVITTNLDPDQLGEQIGQRTVSRIIEICGDPLPLFGHDRRREYRPAGQPGSVLDSHPAMPGIVVVGAQWGDEGRERSSICSRRRRTPSSASRAATTPGTRSSARARSSPCT